MAARKIGVLVFVSLALAGTSPAPAADDPFEQRYHEGAAAIHNNDYGGALKIWLELARQGHADSQFAVGSLYSEGLGAKASIVRAADWWRQAAKQGHAGAQFNLGALYDAGLGVAEDADAAVTWWRKAAEQGHREAIYRVGLSYRQGRGVSRDLRQAHTWLTVAVLKGSVAVGVEAERAAAGLDPQEISASLEDAKAMAAACAAGHPSAGPRG